MKQIAAMCSEEELKKLASRSNFRYGQEIYKDGEIVFVQDEALHKVAKVNFRSNETRTVDVLSTPKGLKWKCTCTSRKDLFCKHYVAVGLHIYNSKLAEKEL